MENKKIPDFVYHYTKMPTLVKLLDTRNLEKTKLPILEFHASDIETFNDRSEYNGIRKLLQDINKSKTDVMFQKALNGLVFVISFSLNNDNMFMWQQYADEGRGICLKFNTQKLYQSLIPQKQEPYEYIRLGNCIYEETEDLRCKYEKLKCFYENKVVNKDIWDRQDDFIVFQLSSSLLKNKGFKDEREYRLLKTESKYHFACSEHEFHAYTTINIPFDCLEEIQVGPCADFEIAKHNIEVWAEPITQTETHKIKITRSNVIFRQ